MTVVLPQLNVGLGIYGRINVLNVGFTIEKGSIF
jgi:hypothetical protein